MSKILGLDVAQRRSNRGLVILGLDLSLNRSGCAAWDILRHTSSMDVRSIITKTLAKQKGILQLDAFSDAFHDLLEEIMPDFIAIEAPRQDIQMFTTPDGKRVPNPGSTLPINQIYGVARAELRSYARRHQVNLPFETVADSTWRKAMYGFGRKTGWKDDDWKNEAKTRCRDHLGVHVRNGDEAEAVMVARYARDHMDSFKKIRNQTERAA